jgi:flavin reductase (DIM6/NTAB) family NADH-FMN oxidoreductase RutF
MMAIDESLFRQTMRFWSTGVTIVTSKFQDLQHGMTVSSFTSVSVNPPVVCVSIHQQTRTYELIEKSRIFAVSVLAEPQGPISECFAGRVADEGDRFYGIDTFTMETGAPMMLGGLAFFDCKVLREVAFGLNTIFFGEVVAARYDETEKPLLYSNRSYQSLQK